MKDSNKSSLLFEFHEDNILLYKAFPVLYAITI